MTVDFHVHSTASDGTFAPRDIATDAVRGGFAALALTDHDNCDGIGEFLGAEPGLRKVAGVELSIEPGEGFDKFHLLALGIDPENEALKAFLKGILDGRDARNERIVGNFRRIGIEMVDVPKGARPVGDYAHGDVLARPHFARWLADNGYAADIGEAFEKYLLPDSPAETRCYEERYHPPQEEAFRVVHGAGGLCVMAHPKYWRREWMAAGPDYAAAGRELARLKEAGLDGLETHYRANLMEENVGFLRVADRLGLLKSAGSDFHGANKPAIPLGMEVSEAFISPLLERLGSCATRAWSSRSSS